MANDKRSIARRAIPGLVAFLVGAPVAAARADQPVTAEQAQVQSMRYGMEAAALRSFMHGVAARGFDAGKPPVVFFDSLLVISFAELLPDEQREFYVKEITSLLDTSRQTGVPLVGYIDTSYARDLVNMLQAAFDLPDALKRYYESLEAAPEPLSGLGIQSVETPPSLEDRPSCETVSKPVVASLECEK